MSFCSFGNEFLLFRSEFIDFLFCVLSILEVFFFNLLVPVESFFGETLGILNHLCILLRFWTFMACFAMQLGIVILFMKALYFFFIVFNFYFQFFNLFLLRCKFLIELLVFLPQMLIWLLKDIPDCVLILLIILLFDLLWFIFGLGGGIATTGHR